MINQRPDETRSEYLLRVVEAFIRQNPLVEEAEVDYDGTTCDGNCLAEDCRNEWEELQLKK